jgi:hypothetical protein
MCQLHDGFVRIPLKNDQTEIIVWNERNGNRCSFSCVWGSTVSRDSRIVDSLFSITKWKSEGRKLTWSRGTHTTFPCCQVARKAEVKDLFPQNQIWKGRDRQNLGCNEIDDLREERTQESIIRDHHHRTLETEMTRRQERQERASCVCVSLRCLTFHSSYVSFSLCAFSYLKCSLSFGARRKDDTHG